VLKRRAFIPTIWIVLLFFSSLTVWADMIVDTAWVRRYNGPENWIDWAEAITTDGFDNVYVTGTSYDTTGSCDYATIRYYPHGDTAWVRWYDGTGNGWDVVSGIAADDSSHVLVTGTSKGNGTKYDCATIKYLPNGDTAWVRRYDGPASFDDAARAIAVDAFGNVYVTGYSRDSATYYDYCTIKYYPHGDTAWVRKYNGPGNHIDMADAITLDSSGNVYVTGSSFSREAFRDYATIKYYPGGEVAWVRRYDGPAYLSDSAVAIAVDGSGNVCVTGRSWNGTDYDYATIKYYPDGDTAWVRRYDGPGGFSDSAVAVAVDGSGNVYVTGSSWVTGTDCDYATIKYSPNGDISWVRRYDGPANGRDKVSAMVIDGVGGIYVTGGSEGEGSSFDYATVKYDSSGNEVWIRRYNSPANMYDWAYAIAVDDSGDVHVAGISINSGTSYDFVTIKYVQTGLWRGDANKDGVVEVGDVIFLINYLYRNGPAPHPVALGDCSCDQVLDLSDLLILINYLFKSGPPLFCL
jgi:hypothetical protein